MAAWVNASELELPVPSLASLVENVPAYFLPSFLQSALLRVGEVASPFFSAVPGAPMILAFARLGAKLLLLPLLTFFHGFSVLLAALIVFFPPISTIICLLGRATGFGLAVAVHLGGTSFLGGLRDTGWSCELPAVPAAQPAVGAPASSGLWVVGSRAASPPAPGAPGIRGRAASPAPSPVKDSGERWAGAK